MDTMNRVTELISVHNMTLVQLAELSNIPYVTLNKARKRHSQLSVDTIERICKGLQISMAEFFSEEADSHDN